MSLMKKIKKAFKKEEKVAQPITIRTAEDAIEEINKHPLDELKDPKVGQVYVLTDKGWELKDAS